MCVKLVIWSFEKHIKERKELETIKPIPIILISRNVRNTYLFKEGAKSKTYSVTIKSAAHIGEEAFQNREYFKEKAKLRTKTAN